MKYFYGMSFWRGTATSSITIKDHAVRRMLERNIYKLDILDVLFEGEIIESYADDSPYPSCLIYKKVNEKPIHIVAAYNQLEDEIIIITAYVPDDSHFEIDYKTRKLRKL